MKSVQFVMVALFSACTPSEPNDLKKVRMAPISLEYDDTLRTLMPFRLASSLGGRVVASTIVYPSVGTERALFLVRDTNGDHRLIQFHANSYLYGACHDDPTRDIDVVRDFSRREIPLSSVHAKRMVALWTRAMGAELPDDRATCRLGGNVYEVGLLAAKGGFVRRELWPYMLDTPDSVRVLSEDLLSGWGEDEAETGRRVIGLLNEGTSKSSEK